MGCLLWAENTKSKLKRRHALNRQLPTSLRRRRQMRVPLYHRERAPAAELLDGSEIDTDHHETRRESVPVPVPRASPPATTGSRMIETDQEHSNEPRTTGHKLLILNRSVRV